MKILLIGSGGREHAIARCLHSTFTGEPLPHGITPVSDTFDATALELWCTPGNPGTSRLAEHIDLPSTDGPLIASWARDHAIDLVIIGPEAPLIAGVADEMRAAGIPVFGPSRAAAAIEGSKAFAKEIMAEAGVPTARARICTSADEVRHQLASTTPPYVVKDDGLANGKGVIVTNDLDAALSHALTCVEREGGRVLIEDYLDGPEVSLFCLCDGHHVVPLLPAQDFKRVGDGDSGPNTGGMGAYAPLSWLTDDFCEQIVSTIAQPVIRTMADRGSPFVGLLYCGLACTSQGVRVIEFNARFGDPETQVVLPLLRSSLAIALYACATGQLKALHPLQWSDEYCLGVVACAENYPGTPVTGDAIEGITIAEDRVTLQANNATPSTHIIVAGATIPRRTGGSGSRDDASPTLSHATQLPLTTSGGRVLAAVSQGSSLAQAKERAYAALDSISFRGIHFRRDIGARAVDGAITEQGGNR